MHPTYQRSVPILLSIATLVAAALACQGSWVDIPPTPEALPSETPETSPPEPTTSLPPTAEESPGAPNLAITNAALSTSTPAAGGWVALEVTVQNQGDAAASGFELVLIPHYNWGPPNPAGYELIPDLAPGTSHTVSFSPGVLYSDPGIFTLRVLVTDNWYASGNPDSTGSAGDYQDILITVSEPAATGPNLAITYMVLDTTTPPVGGWVLVTVSVENQGGAAASGFELVLIPHYGWGPPNPAGYELIPDLAPGATWTKAFTPGVLYGDAGTFTLRVLVTDDWYEIGSPDSTGSGGDLQDSLITVGGR